MKKFGNVENFIYICTTEQLCNTMFHMEVQIKMKKIIQFFKKLLHIGNDKVVVTFGKSKPEDKNTIVIDFGFDKE